MTGPNPGGKECDAMTLHVLDYFQYSKPIVFLCSSYFPRLMDWSFVRNFMPGCPTSTLASSMPRSNARIIFLRLIVRFTIYCLTPSQTIRIWEASSRTRITRKHGWMCCGFWQHEDGRRNLSGNLLLHLSEISCRTMGGLTTLRRLMLE